MCSRSRCRAGCDTSSTAAGDRSTRAKSFSAVGQLTGLLQAVTDVEDLLSAAALAWTAVHGRLVDLETSHHGHRVAPPTPPPIDRSRRSFHGRLAAHIKTQESAFFEPILTALIEMGGAGDVAAVLDRVGVAMQGRFVPADLLPLKGKRGDTIRWRNSAQWARNTMVEMGLLMSNSRRGKWEISDRGRAWLADLQPPQGR